MCCLFLSWYPPHKILKYISWSSDEVSALWEIRTSIFSVLLKLTEIIIRWHRKEERDKFNVVAFYKNDVQNESETVRERYLSCLKNYFLSFDKNDFFWKWV